MTMIALFVTLVTIGLVSADCSGNKCDDNCRVNTFLTHGDYDCGNCRDAGIYTLNSVWTSNQKCELDSVKATTFSLTWHKTNGETVVNILVPLFQHRLPMGDTLVYIGIYHVISGNLVGKYVMRREKYKIPYYLKKCSTILGYTSITSESGEIVINSKLDLLTYISPAGRWDDFKKGSSAVCTGLVHVF